MFTIMSDDVLRLSMLTLIHRAMPHNDLKTTFSDECIASARHALERHEALIRDLDLKESIMLATYINWYIHPPVCIVHPDSDNQESSGQFSSCRSSPSLRSSVTLSRQATWKISPGCKHS